ncbi:class II aldolase [Sphingomonas sp. MA1305]|uniref:class II aldolase/adducin family protein n=1 Tax=Sphingomonas sp. MA1305 TaxID=2479204 RepID=UPI0018DFB799|nr:class II aldolase/adducin family protein [Sphingomonas sp. MA1305]MBI0477177.1 class II aldolase [Sphingomonas sp. MA1305]
MMTGVDPPTLCEELRRATLRWGENFLLAQGAGGNTSIKYDDRLLVKASGYRLKDAARRDIFVEVARADGLRMAMGGATPTGGSDGRRASIETSLHAILPQRVVVHLHMIPLIAIAIRMDAEAVLADRLAGLRWGMVGYHKPGVDLAQAVQALLDARGPLSVLVLANHGLVVAADTILEAETLVTAVMERVEESIPPPPAPDSRLATCASALGGVPVNDPAAHRLAFDDRLAHLAASGSFYPDHVVFLGHAARLGTAATPPGRPPGKLSIIPGLGCLLPPGLPSDAHDMAACIAETLARVPVGAPLNVLTADEERELVDWDAEKYRQQLSQQV